MHNDPFDNGALRCLRADLSSQRAVMSWCCGVVIFVLVFTGMGAAEKVMVYDEVRGIIFVDPDSVGRRPGVPVSRSVEAAKTSSVNVSETTVVTRKNRSVREDLHLNRKRDPVELYFKSALEYFRNGDGENALRNFRYADSLDHKPAYLLWIGKTYRLMGRADMMLLTMGRLLKDAPRSEVADDALFEIAFHHQVNDNYDSATQYYAQLAEQYPFGTSFSNGEPFLEVSREQRKAMRQEMADKLLALGYNDDDLAQRYRRFQRAQKIEITAGASPATVRAVKAQYLRLAQLHGTSTSQILQARRRLKYAMAAGVFLLLLSSGMLVVLLLIRGRSRRLLELRQVLQELDINKPLPRP